MLQRITVVNLLASWHAYSYYENIAHALLICIVLYNGTLGKIILTECGLRRALIKA